ncbi:MAG TPA: hypothetical protein VHC70_09320, partial [Phycisphaerales bacterium]|nr:hypothetical protein [Phycisphaerales bacterium]
RAGRGAVESSAVVAACRQLPGGRKVRARCRFKSQAKPTDAAPDIAAASAMGARLYGGGGGRPGGWTVIAP